MGGLGTLGPGKNIVIHLTCKFSQSTVLAGCWVVLQNILFVSQKFLVQTLCTSNCCSNWDSVYNLI